MNKFSFILILAFFTGIGHISADPWECMSETEVKELMSFLKKNPYVFDYCDCCDEVSRKYDNKKLFGHLIKIEKMEIVTCSWDDTQFSVNIVKSSIILSGNVEKGKLIAADLDVKNLAPYNGTWPITLNYCWTYKAGKISRLFKNIKYDNEDVKCGGISEFPDPKKVPAEFKKGYQKFYRRK